ncbi:hypothetical protein FZEAL_1179 [Fusarium zealandicum]|uniref:Tail specific protease domain-containing protein n=1 Tax=Fusarium zealandicum TaxID=1053134 RepID=A0A8H4XP43_9HYPO|nr:hypothetical protein FZEAL_1179 [Fusarium zealandicum]
MVSSLGVLALVGFAAAALEPGQVMHETRHQPAFIHSRDVKDSEAEPCKFLSQVYDDGNFKKGQQAIVNVPPSVGVACLKSVPVDKERDLGLLDYLEPLISFQSTLEILADPPEEYLFPGVDVLGGLEVIRDNLKKNKYKSQYGVMSDLRSLFVAANDNHFGYAPNLFNVFAYLRRGLDFQAVSPDGVRTPLIYHSTDIMSGNKNELDYFPSAVESVNDVPVFEWLEDEAARNVKNSQDPDAQFNRLSITIPRIATGSPVLLLSSQFEIPDTYTIKFYNGSKLEFENQIIFSNTFNFTGIDSGEAFHEYFELVPADISDPTANERRSASETKTDAVIPGYPKPVVKHSESSISGYFLEGDDYKDIAVLSILSFLPIGPNATSTDKLNITDYVLEAEDLLLDFMEQAEETGRDKLIIDLSGNGGGSVVLADSIYRLLFPDGEFSVYNRYRANSALEAATAADYDAFFQNTIGKYYPVSPDNEPIETGKEWFGPYTTKGGQNVTAAFENNKTAPWDSAIPAYLNGFDPDNKPLVEKAPWKPENILIVTDGTCASACCILTGLLTRNHGIRTLALGGRPLNLAMQAMGGVKGTILKNHADLVRETDRFFYNAANDTKTRSILRDAEDAFPSLDNPPLLPLPVGAGGGGQINGYNGYTADDLDGYPVHFRYEAANCRLFYTQRMLAYPADTWKRAAGVAWNGEGCVPGSTTNENGTIGDNMSHTAWDAQEECL